MAKSNTVSYQKVRIRDGFWKERQGVNAERTQKAIFDLMKSTGRLKAYEFDWKLPKDQWPDYLAHDSALAKWIEGVAYIVNFGRDPEVEAVIDDYIDAIDQRQWPDGYFHSHFGLKEPDKRFTDYTAHELYMLGHMLEAAIAYEQATGKDKLTKMMIKYVDLADRVFRVEHSAAFDTPGHEEVELALYKLYRHTGEERFMELLRYFINERGYSKRDKTYDFFGDNRYSQAHLPVREQETAEGHAVRGVYLYCAMADMAWQDDDEGLKRACEVIFDNIRDRRMYITGAIGSCHIGESFTFDYDLMNRAAYTETCANLGLALFARRLSIIDPKGKYGDVAELAVYNGTLAGISLDGEKFFYENPLEVQPALYNQNQRYVTKDHMPAITRQHSFDCPCCPPNIFRFIGQIGDFAFSENEDTLFIHQFLSCDAETRWGTVSMRTGYPYDGKIEVSLLQGGDYTVAIRIPGWAESYALSVNGEKLNTEVKDGYAYIRRNWAQGDGLILDLPMTLKFMTAHPAVHEDCGRLALMRGPIVYCLEEADNGVWLKDIAVSRDAKYAIEQDETLGVPTIVTTGFRRKWPEGELYTDKVITDKEVPVRLIPYYAWDNRGENEMIIWVREK